MRGNQRTILLIVTLLATTLGGSLCLAVEYPYITFEGTVRVVMADQPDWDIIFLTSDGKIFTISGHLKEDFRSLPHIKVCVTGTVFPQRISQTSGDIKVEQYIIIDQSEKYSTKWMAGTLLFSDEGLVVLNDNQIVYVITEKYLADKLLSHTNSRIVYMDDVVESHDGDFNIKTSFSLYKIITTTKSDITKRYPLITKILGEKYPGIRIFEITKITSNPDYKKNL